MKGRRLSLVLTRLLAACRGPLVAAGVSLLCRAGWALMLVVHTPGTLSALGLGERPFEPLRAAGLLAACAIFALKIADVRWLRLPRDRRVWLAVAIGVALLHAGVVAPGLLSAVPDWPAWSAALALVIVSAPVLSACAARAARRRFNELLHSLIDRMRSAELSGALRRSILFRTGVVQAVRPPPALGC